MSIQPESENERCDMAASARLKVARCMDALSHPRRAMIFDILSEAGRDGLRFEELLERSGLTVPVLSQHLQPMVAASIVMKRRKGVYVFHRLHEGALAQSLSWVQRGLERAAGG